MEWDTLVCASLAIWQAVVDGFAGRPKLAVFASGVGFAHGEPAELGVGKEQALLSF